MSHSHLVKDSDAVFIIDPISREITTETDNISLMQYDHNSEIFTFQIPKIVEGHDMSLCNKVEIHYTNIDKRKKETSNDIYPVTDLTVDDSNILFTWTVSSNATKYAGSLNFLIRFACMEDDGTFSYIWHTNIFKNVTISNGINNTEAVAEDYSDILEKMKDDIKQTDFEQNDNEAIDYLKNRPFYDLGNISNNIEWDGDITNKVSDNEGYYYKVSDLIPNVDEMLNIGIVSSDGTTEEITTRSIESVIDNSYTGYYLWGENLSVVIINQPDSEFFTETGIYFSKDSDAGIYVASLTWETANIKKLDKKYLPLILEQFENANFDYEFQNKTEVYLDSDGKLYTVSDKSVYKRFRSYSYVIPSEITDPYRSIGVSTSYNDNADLVVNIDDSNYLNQIHIIRIYYQKNILTTSPVRCVGRVDGALVYCATTFNKDCDLVICKFVLDGESVKLYMRKV